MLGFSIEKISSFKTAPSVVSNTNPRKTLYKAGLSSVIVSQSQEEILLMEFSFQKIHSGSFRMILSNKLGAFLSSQSMNFERIQTIKNMLSFCHL